MLEEGDYYAARGNEQMEVSIIKDNKQRLHCSIRYGNYDKNRNETAQFVWNQDKRDFVMEESEDSSIHISVQGEKDGLLVELFLGREFISMRFEKTQWLNVTNVVLAIKEYFK